MPTDEELTVYTILHDNWNASTVAEPTFYYDDSIRDHDYRTKNAVKIYFVDQTERPIGLGYTSKATESRVTVDFRGAKRDTVLKIRDEAIRCLDLKRKAPATGYDMLVHDGGMKHAGYSDFYHFTIDCKLIQHAKAI